MLRINHLNMHLLVLQIRDNFLPGRVFFDLEELSSAPFKTPPFLLQLINLLCIIYRA
jgi:hypothetical protein